MSEETPILAEAEEAQHKELLNNLGILVSEEELDARYRRSLEFCDGDEEKAQNVTTHYVRVFDEAPRLADALSEGKLAAVDLYDSTGRLTLAGQIARTYVEDRLNPADLNGTADQIREVDAKFKTLLGALNAQRVEDEGAARVAAEAQDNSREKQQAQQFVASVTDDPLRAKKAYDPYPVYKAIDTETDRPIAQATVDGLSRFERADVKERARENASRLHHAQREAEDAAIVSAKTRAGSGFMGVTQTVLAKVKGEYTPAELARPTTEDVNVAAQNLAHGAGQQAQAVGEQALADYQQTQSEEAQKLVHG